MTESRLEKILGYKFHSPELLERALTHGSWVNENASSDSPLRDNERLEFLGDSVLGLVTADWLFENHPTLDEGDMTQMKHRLVSTVTLARIAAEIGLGEAVRVSRGEERSGGRKKTALLADTMEAVIGAVFLDAGYDKAREFVIRLFADELKNASPTGSTDFKTLLQERLQARKLPTPTYSLLETTGPPHDRSFRVKAEWHGGSVEGTGRSIKAAEMSAASLALEMIDQET